MRLHERFDWDPAKARLNEVEHEVAFQEARLVLEQDDGDIYLIESYDDEHSRHEADLLQEAFLRDEGGEG